MKRKETVRELTILIDRLRSQERSIQAQIRSVEETLKLYSNEAPIDVVLQPDDKTTVRLWPPEEPVKEKPKHWTQTPEGKKRMSQIQKKIWKRKK